MALRSPRGGSGPLQLRNTEVVCFWTGSGHGDQRPVIEHRAAPPGEVPSSSRVAGLHQVHGADVLDVGTTAGAALCDGDAALASDSHTCPAVLVADCVPIAIGSPEGVRVAVHGGWRGLTAGVVAHASAAARAAGASRLVAGIGPCIGPCCYEFSEPDLAGVASVLGDAVRAETRAGRPALDLRAAASAALDGSGVDVDFEEPACTACGTGWYSARARRDQARQALYLWRADL
jgi:polyphenol oxidase